MPKAQKLNIGDRAVIKPSFFARFNEIRSTKDRTGIIEEISDNSNWPYKLKLKNAIWIFKRDELRKVK